MCVRVRGVHFFLFLRFSVGFWNCSYSVVKFMAGLSHLIGSQSSPHDNWIPSSVLFLIVEHVNIDTACTKLESYI
jgi:hypothetical protein